MSGHHLDEHGGVCTHHPVVDEDELLALAVVGSRAPSFHHDLASKLQGLMMAVDEIGELTAEASAGVTRAIDTAHTTLREVLALLNLNRALTKAPIKASTPLAEMLARASERVYVNIAGALPAAMLEVSAPSLIHALSLVLDVAGGPGRGRSVAASGSIADGSVTVTLAASSDPPVNAPASLALAAYVLAREGGELRCGQQGKVLSVRLPVAAPAK